MILYHFMWITHWTTIKKARSNPVAHMISQQLCVMMCYPFVIVWSAFFPLICNTNHFRFIVCRCSSSSLCSPSSAISAQPWYSFDRWWLLMILMVLAFTHTALVHFKWYRSTLALSFIGLDGFLFVAVVFFFSITHQGNYIGATEHPLMWHIESWCVLWLPAALCAAWWSSNFDVDPRIL